MSIVCPPCVHRVSIVPCTRTLQNTTNERYPGRWVWLFGACEACGARGACGRSLETFELLERAIEIHGGTPTAMKFRILEDTSASGLQAARKEILRATNTHDRNRAALRLSDSLEKARGFHGTGMLEYQLQARKLLQTLGRDVSNLKRDLQDQEYKRKKEIGYPVTPIADRRQKTTRGKENGAMALEFVTLSPEPRLSHGRQAAELKEELKALQTDDRKWTDKRKLAPFPFVSRPHPKDIDRVTQQKRGVEHGPSTGRRTHRPRSSSSKARRSHPNDIDHVVEDGGRPENGDTTSIHKQTTDKRKLAPFPFVSRSHPKDIDRVTQQKSGVEHDPNGWKTTQRPRTSSSKARRSHPNDIDHAVEGEGRPQDFDATSIHKQRPASSSSIRNRPHANALSMVAFANRPHPKDINRVAQDRQRKQTAIFHRREKKRSVDRRPTRLRLVRGVTLAWNADGATARTSGSDRKRFYKRLKEHLLPCGLERTVRPEQDDDCCLFCLHPVEACSC